jgi:hypothetical protein
MLLLTGDYTPELGDVLVSENFQPWERTHQRPEVRLVIEPERREGVFLDGGQVGGPVARALSYFKHRPRRGVRSGINKNFLPASRERSDTQIFMFLILFLPLRPLPLLIAAKKIAHETRPGPLISR